MAALRLLSVGICLILPAACLPAHAHQGVATGSTASVQSDLNLTVEPATLFPGQQYTLLLTLSEGDCDKVKTGAVNPLIGLEIKSASTDALSPGTPIQPVGNPCETTLPATVGKDAQAGKLILYLMGKAESGKPAPILGMVPVNIQLQKGPGAIPPGLKPSLDLMWKVLPRRAVADSFGNRVADHYFQIEAVLGNETGYDLQLSALGFDVPQVFCRTDGDEAKIKRDDPSWDHCKAKKGASSEEAISTIISSEPIPKPGNSAIVPVDAYPVVRGTVEREQFVGTRAFLVNLTKGASSVLVGVGGFYPDDSRFVRSAGIVSGPFEKALELVYPDLTTSHLINLDSRTLRDGATVPNNTSFRINAFISREIVECTYPGSLWRLGLSPRGAYYNCAEDDGRLPWAKNFDPKQIMLRLGSLELIGRKIQYLERERVLTRTDNLPQSQGGPVLSSNKITVDRSTAQEFILSGTNLHGAKITSSTTCLKLTSPPVAADDTSIKFNADSSGCSPKANLKLQVGSPYGFFLVDVAVVPHTPTITTPNVTIGSDSTAKIEGAFLWDARVDSTPSVTISRSEVTDDGKTLIVTVDSSALKPGIYSLTVTTPSGPADTKVVLTKN